MPRVGCRSGTSRRRSARWNWCTWGRTTGCTSPRYTRGGPGEPCWREGDGATATTRAVRRLAPVGSERSIALATRSIAAQDECRFWLPETTGTNPQFHVQIPRAETDASRKCHVVVSVTQQYEIAGGPRLCAIGFCVYELPPGAAPRRDLHPLQGLVRSSVRDRGRV